MAEGKTLPPPDITGIPDDVSELSVAQLQVPSNAIELHLWPLFVPQRSELLVVLLANAA